MLIECHAKSKLQKNILIFISTMHTVYKNIVRKTRIKVFIYEQFIHTHSSTKQNRNNKRHSMQQQPSCYIRHFSSKQYLFLQNAFSKLHVCRFTIILFFVIIMYGMLLNEKAKQTSFNFLRKCKKQSAKII